MNEDTPGYEATTALTRNPTPSSSSLKFKPGDTVRDRLYKSAVGCVIEEFLGKIWVKWVGKPGSHINCYTAEQAQRYLKHE